MAATNERHYDIVDADLANLQAKQSGIETVADGDTGIEMFGYKDNGGNLYRLLAKDQIAHTLDLHINDTAGVAKIVHGGDTDNYIKMEADKQTFHVGGTDALVITEAATDVITVGFDIDMNAKELQAGAGNNFTIELGDNAAANKLSVQDSDDAEIFVIDSDGNVGMYMTPATSRLDIKCNASHYGISLVENSGAEEWEIGVNADGDLGFYNDGVLRHSFLDATTNSVTRSIAVSATQSVYCYSATLTSTPYLVMARSHNDDGVTTTTTLDTEHLGGVYVYGVDSGGVFDRGGSIDFTQVGAAGTRVPCKMEFSTSSSTATAVALTINETQFVGFGTAPDVFFHLDSGAADCDVKLETDDGYDLQIEGYQGATCQFVIGYDDTDDTLRLINGAALAETTGIVINTGGYIGLGGNPGDWDRATINTLIDFEKKAALVYDPGDDQTIGLTRNAIYDNAGNKWEYIEDNYASRLSVGIPSLGFSLQMAASGTAGAAITWNTILSCGDANELRFNPAAGDIDFYMYGDSGLVAMVDAGQDEFRFYNGSGGTVAWDRAKGTFEGNLPTSAAAQYDWLISSASGTTDGWIVKIRQGA